MGTGLRIIGGSLKGRRLTAPPGEETRPTGSRVREAIFNILAPDIQDAAVLDLFAGSGALAIEAVSRGAQHAVCIDRSTPAIRVIQKNIDACNLNDRVRTVQWDAHRNLRCLDPATERYHLVFMDPPYTADLVPVTLAHLVRQDVLHPGATIVVEHDARESMTDLPDRLEPRSQRAYGKTLVSFLTFVI